MADICRGTVRRTGTRCTRAAAWLIPGVPGIFCRQHGPAVARQAGQRHMLNRARGHLLTVAPLAAARRRRPTDDTPLAASIPELLAELASARTEHDLHRARMGLIELHAYTREVFAALRAARRRFETRMLAEADAARYRELHGGS